MSVRIHPTAIVEAGAELAEDVEVGPYALIGPGVRIGAGSSVGPHCVIRGLTDIGVGNRIFQFCSIGEVPQDKKYAGEPTRLVIGDRNTIREFCTFNCGTAQDAGVTRIGSDNWIMAYVHVAHDCVIGDRVIIANSSQLAGHVCIGDHAILGGFTGVHQFCSIGAHCITSVGSVVLQDIAPFVMAAGNPAEPKGINSEGLRRRGHDAATVQAVKRAYRTLYRSGLPLEEARAELERQAAEVPLLGLLTAFIATQRRGLAR
ncbi:MAG: acyl-ACP--UDP-N-acetylglucosamine O-acyltransferase [bacterium]|jgi:UDP-N-acetylglucosamine acyltransferase|nr:acyl-ACP--UDP-N-acetylglucosamine O-acyltransferase [Betaproteobacteria bacterium]